MTFQTFCIGGHLFEFAEVLRESRDTVPQKSRLRECDLTLMDFPPGRYDVLSRGGRIQQMTSIGTLSGLGKFWDGNQDLGPVRYTIEVFRDGGIKRGEGTLRWAGYGPWDSYQAGKPLMLMVSTGEQVSITITSPRKEGADILATAPIPDPIDWLSGED